MNARRARHLVVRLLRSRLFCCAAVVITQACKGVEPPPPPTTGDIRVGASTTGLDLDPDGYTVALDSTTAGLDSTPPGVGKPVAVNGTVTFSHLSPRSYSITLRGNTANCLVGSANPRSAAVTAGETTQVTFQISCQQRVEVSGVWNYTEITGSLPFACTDTGSYVFVSGGDGFGGTNDQVGTCNLENGAIDNASSSSIGSGGVQYVSSGSPHVLFSVGSCSYSAEVSGSPPSHLVNGSVNCGTGAGTWEAVKGGGAIQSLTVSPLARSVLAGATARLRAVMIDASGSRRVGPSVAWSSDAPALATVNAAGVVSGVAPGSATITAAEEAQSGTATVNVAVVTFASVQAGAYHSCGLASSGGAYCWGYGAYGEIGDGTRVSDPAPVAVAGGLTFAALSVGAIHSCGLSASGAAYCWGLDYYGELGAGTAATELCTIEGAECSTTPLAVAGGNTFSSLSAGWEESCALTSSGAAYCWGDNTFGQLGDGSKISTRTPVPVTGGLAFTSIGTGNIFACGLTAAGAAYCWGNNTAGQLGIGPTSPEVCSGEPCSTSPMAVSGGGGLTFTALSVGYWHACGLTSSGTVYCWGDNVTGQLGALSSETCSGLDGSVPCSRVPVLVATSTSFARISAGSFHSCGLTGAGNAYCWGLNGDGQLGNGTTITSPYPSPVAGGLSFSAMSAFGRWHSCALSTAGLAYCWGFNGTGALGDGTYNSERQPVQVLGQAPVPASVASRGARLRPARTPAAGRSPSIRPPGP